MQTKTSIKQYIGTFFIAALCGYFLYIFISYPALYIIPWLYELLGIAEKGCGFAIQQGLTIEIFDGCTTVQFNIEAITTGIAVAIASVIIVISQGKNEK